MQNSDKLTILQKNLNLLSFCFDNAIGQITYNCKPSDNLPSDSNTPNNYVDNEFKDLVYFIFLFFNFID